MVSCALCDNAPCDAACPAMIKPAARLRSIWLGGEKHSAVTLPAHNACEECSAPCEKACLRSGKVPIKSLMSRLKKDIMVKLSAEALTDEEALQTDICGIPIENPFLLSSSVVASTYDMCARAFDTGWAGACFKTVCNFPIHECSPRFSALQGNNNEFIGFKNIEQLSDHTVEENMTIFQQLKKNYPNKFILASFMGQNEKEWAELAKKCQDAGADALELNFSCPNMADGGLGSDIGQIPELVEKLTHIVKKSVSIPIIAKLTPNVANMSPSAEAALKAGADGIAAINTIKSITGVNLHTFVGDPSVHGKFALGGYSGVAVKPIALRFIAELGQNSMCRQKNAHITAMGGIENWTDAAEFILLGAKSIQITTAVMQYGYRIIEDLKSGLALYMNQKGFKSVPEMSGLGLDSFSMSTDTLERDTIIYPKFIKERCIGCGRCVISCRDGGHQALSLVCDESVCDDDNRGTNLGSNRRKIRLNAKKCVGCHLCILVCPQKAMVSSEIRR